MGYTKKTEVIKKFLNRKSEKRPSKYEISKQAPNKPNKKRDEGGNSETIIS
jgi:hypothetical protein